jgi:uncharacterized protein YyaL (SSP411 family)
MSTHADRPANHLAGETSPYLLQHVHNPVDWWPWGEEALRLARETQRPIFLSVGYSACHWCHVMERESFEDARIAVFMNEHFVNIKVDREERPDIDQIYMNAVQALTGQGGWPMSVWLTPDLGPFYGGTYFPPEDRYGRPGFLSVLQGVANAWQARRDDVARAASELTDQLRAMASVPRSEGPLDVGLLDRAARHLARAFEPIHGGFGSAPKFPHPMDLKILLRQYARTGDSHARHMVRYTLDKMSRGGIFDHLGGGFARYSTDNRWLVPHFEKMLYDNALLTSVYVETFQLTHDPDLAEVARSTIDYVLGRMPDPEGPFYSTEDADSEGVEGKFYVWDIDEIESTLGPNRTATFAYVYDVRKDGNWEHKNILNMPRSMGEAARALGREEAHLRREMAECRADLLAVRDRRVPPGKDTKILTSWNGLMIATLADAAHALDAPHYLDSAEKAAAFVLDRIRDRDGRLFHAYKDGRARFRGCLDDYAALIDGLTRLFEATGQARWLEAALELTEIMVADFADPEGGFFYTGEGHEALIARQKDVYDNATPSGNGLAAIALARLSALTGRDDLRRLALETLAAARIVLEEAPSAAGQSLIALDFLLGPVREVALFAGKDEAEARAVLREVAGAFRPHKVVAPAFGPPSDEVTRLVPSLADRGAIDGKTTTYVCVKAVCQLPIMGLTGLAEALGPFLEAPR